MEAAANFSRRNVMSRISFCLALCLAAQSSLLAGDPVANQPPRQATSPVHMSSATMTRFKAGHELQGRKKIEALLQTVANLDYGDRETVTVKEVLDDLHRQHHLSIRFDFPTLSPMISAAADFQAEMQAIGTDIQPLSPVDE